MYKKIFILGLCANSFVMFAQKQPKDSIIELSSIEVIADLPITKEIIGKKKIESKNLGQDMPFLLKNATGVVITSDAGAGVGYTGLRLRGIGQDQINVTFNGVPVNDSESQGVYWVDFPDISSSTGGVVIQRGVGTSSNGATSFGGSVNLDTDQRTKEVGGELMAAFGSFDTQKFMFKGSTGDFANNKLNMDIRGTSIHSDGYIDRASSDLASVTLNARYMPSKNTEIHLLNIFGYERTYQAWNGVSKGDIDSLKIARTFNPAGAIYGSDWKTIKGYYKNEVDNYNQNHTHLYWTQKYANGWKSKTTLHYTKGLGFYENYKQGSKLAKYNIHISGLKNADAIRRKWLDNDFFGGIFNVENTKLRNTKLYMGVAANKYIGDHYGEIIKLVGVPNYQQNGYYYNNTSNKIELSAFAKVLRKFGKFEAFGDVQLRKINYDCVWFDDDAGKIKNADLKYMFFNPKAGINYYLAPSSKVYLSYGIAHREPTREDIKNGAEKAEQLQDIELGYRVSNKLINFGINAYYMMYKDQLVLTGKLDSETGARIRQNVGSSYRRGVELDAEVKLINNKLNIFGNVSYSQNKNKDYITSEGKNLGDTDIAYSPNLVSSFGLGVKPIKNLDINLVNKYVSSQYVTNTQNDKYQLESYFLSDLTINYDISLGKEESMQLSFMLNNLFDEKYSSNGYYADWEGPKLYVYPQAGRNFLAGVKFYF